MMMHGGGREFLSGLVMGLIMIWPVWRIFARAGLSAAWSLLIFVPVVGWLAAAAVLAFSDWRPAGDPAAAAREDAP